jgi:hypothetical protein
VLRETTSRGLCGLVCPSRTILPGQVLARIVTVSRHWGPPVLQVRCLLQDPVGATCFAEAVNAHCLMRHGLQSLSTQPGSLAGWQISRAEVLSPGPPPRRATNSEKVSDLVYFYIKPLWS